MQADDEADFQLMLTHIRKWQVKCIVLSAVFIILRNILGSG